MLLKKYFLLFSILIISPSIIYSSTKKNSPKNSSTDTISNPFSNSTAFDLPTIQNSRIVNLEIRIHNLQAKFQSIEKNKSSTPINPIASLTPEEFEKIKERVRNLEHLETNNKLLAPHLYILRTITTSLQLQISNLAQKISSLEEHIKAIHESRQAIEKRFLALEKK